MNNAIEIVCLNPAMDRTLFVGDGLRVGEVNRSQRSIVVPGGKGINVARFIRQLAPDLLLEVSGFAGGEIGRYVVEACEQAAIDMRMTPIADETRVCIMLVETAGTTVINEAGPTIAAQEREEYLRNLPAAPSFVVICGSAPPPAGAGMYEELVATYRQRGVQVFVDASGHELRAAVAASPTLVKVNEVEFSQLCGVDCTLSEDELESRARMFTDQGIQVVIVTRGEHGALVVERDVPSVAVPAFKVPVVNATACGDAFLAGLCVARARGLAWVDAACHGTAAAALKAVSFGPILDQPELFASWRETAVAHLGAREGR
ncbi:MAG: 1-phosphofructokinase family hexose kinase [Bacilli bacterium]